jgi:hypothetical protein
MLSNDNDTYSMLLRRQVIGPNIEDLKGLAKLMRENDKFIIEPGSFESPSRLWSQAEFYRFWEQVITEHAERVIFSEGWHLSVGCVYEYLCAVRGTKPCFDQNEDDLPVEMACELIKKGAKDLDPKSLVLSKHRGRIEAMMEAIKFASSEAA